VALAIASWKRTIGSSITRSYSDSAVGSRESAVGESAVGESAVGESAVGQSAVGRCNRQSAVDPLLSVGLLVTFDF
jgi:hypothetical protein